METKNRGEEITGVKFLKTEEKTNFKLQEPTQCLAR